MRDGVIYASNAYIIKLTSLSEKQIQRNLRALVDAGFIHIDTDGKHRKIYLSTISPTKMSGIPDKNVDQIKKDKDDKILYNNTIERAHACEDVRAKYPAMYNYWSNSLPAVSESLVELLADYVDMDAICEIRRALQDIPVYDYCYAMYHDKRKLQRVAKNIGKRNVIRIYEYVSNSFAVPDVWRDVSHMRVLEDLYAES